MLAIDAERPTLYPFRQALLLCRRRLGFLLRWHYAGAHVLKHLPPELTIPEHRLIGLKLVQRNLPLVHAVAVAVVTVLRQKRLDVLSELGCSRDVGSARCIRSNPSNQ